jgi:hypothetical protein
MKSEEPEMSESAYLPKHRNDDPEHDAGYPPYVLTLEQKRRWDLAERVAEAYFAGLEDGERRTQVWSATRVFYDSDWPTGDESEDGMA